MRTLGRRQLMVAAGAAAVAVALPAHAQYASKPWPANRATPALVGADLQGRTWDLAALRGRAVLINFWATWCGPCKAEMPSLQALGEAEGDVLVILAVNVREAKPEVARYVRSAALSFPVLLDSGGDIAHAWGVKAIPTTLLVDSAGRVQRVVSGMVDWVDEPVRGWVKALRS